MVGGPDRQHDEGQITRGPATGEVVADQLAKRPSDRDVDHDILYRDEIASDEFVVLLDVAAGAPLVWMRPCVPARPYHARQRRRKGDARTCCDRVAA